MAPQSRCLHITPQMTTIMSNMSGRVATTGPLMSMEATAMSELKCCVLLQLCCSSTPSNHEAQFASCGGRLVMYVGLSLLAHAD